MIGATRRNPVAPAVRGCAAYVRAPGTGAAHAIVRNPLDPRLRLRRYVPVMGNPEGDAVKRILMVCVLGYIGCGGGAETPVQKCDDLVSDVCDRAVQCSSQPPGTKADCVQAVQQVVSCGMAKKVGTTYDRCIQQIKGDSCQVLFPPDPQTGEITLELPADCNSVIQMFEPADPTPAFASSPLRNASRLSTVAPD